ncbi:hypothetical protein C8Q74DRAFT_761323 [Fomes fomentarius]|nr:hypothetical protein C8Q74DRAFT_761323 [Fomes fomentarius]
MTRIKSEHRSSFRLRVRRAGTSCTCWTCHSDRSDRHGTFTNPTIIAPGLYTYVSRLFPTPSESVLFHLTMLTPFVPHRSGMRNCRLPIEVCEHIIDAAYEHDTWLHKTSYQIWRQTALVCPDWRTRSRLNILRDVDIRCSIHLDLLLRTISETSYLADLILGVCIFSQSEYIPFGRLLVPGLLKKCVTLHLRNLSWRTCPPRYADTNLYPLYGSGLTQLSIQITQGSCTSVLRFVYELPKLQRLILESPAEPEPVKVPPVVLAALETRHCPFKMFELLAATL